METLSKSGEEECKKVPTNNVRGLAIIFIDSHECLLLVRPPAICYRNNEEPDVKWTGSGETHHRIKQYQLEAEVDRLQPVRASGKCRQAKVQSNQAPAGGRSMHGQLPDWELETLGKLKLLTGEFDRSQSDMRWEILTDGANWRRQCVTGIVMNGLGTSRGCRVCSTYDICLQTQHDNIGSLHAISKVLLRSDTMPCQGHLLLAQQPWYRNLTSSEAFLSEEFGHQPASFQGM